MRREPKYKKGDFVITIRTHPKLVYKIVYVSYYINEFFYTLKGVGHSKKKQVFESSLQLYEREESIYECCQQEPT